MTSVADKASRFEKEHQISCFWKSHQIFLPRRNSFNHSWNSNTCFGSGQKRLPTEKTLALKKMKRIIMLFEPPIPPSGHGVPDVWMIRQEIMLRQVMLAVGNPQRGSARQQCKAAIFCGKRYLVNTYICLLFIRRPYISFFRLDLI